MQFQNFSILLLLAIFVAAGVAIWVSGVHLSKATSFLSKRFGLGNAMGGMILLGFVTNLPEIAIVVSASLQNNVEMAVGNILGGISMQTLVLVILDVFGTPKNTSLTYQSGSLPRAIEGMTVLMILALVILGHQLPSSLIFLYVTPTGILILIAWLSGLFLISKAGNGLPWKSVQNPAQNDSSKKENEAKNNDEKKKTSHPKTSIQIIIFLITAIVTLVAGYCLERCGDAIAKDIGMQGLLFGSTVLAAATSLPEISTGLASMKQKNYDMAVSDIFGGNAFLPVLFLIATLISGKAVLPTAKGSDIFLTSLAMILTGIYVFGIVFRPRKKILYMGVDSFIVLIIYALGIFGLFFIG